MMRRAASFPGRSVLTWPSAIPGRASISEDPCTDGQWLAWLLAEWGISRSPCACRHIWRNVGGRAWVGAGNIDNNRPPPPPEVSKTRTKVIGSISGPANGGTGSSQYFISPRGHGYGSRQYVVTLSDQIDPHSVGVGLGDHYGLRLCPGVLPRGRVHACRCLRPCRKRQFNWSEWATVIRRRLAIQAGDPRALADLDTWTDDFRTAKGRLRCRWIGDFPIQYRSVQTCSRHRWHPQEDTVFAKFRAQRHSGRGSFFQLDLPAIATHCSFNNQFTTAWPLPPNWAGDNPGYG